jgi:hypothetical protein
MPCCSVYLAPWRGIWMLWIIRLEGLHCKHIRFIQGVWPHLRLWVWDTNVTYVI